MQELFYKLNKLRSDYSAVADLTVIMLIQQRTDYIIDELVLKVEHIDAEGAYKCKQGYHADLAAYFKNRIHYFSSY